MMPQCNATTKAGKRCKAAAERNRKTCIFHTNKSMIARTVWRKSGKVSNKRRK